MGALRATSIAVGWPVFVLAVVACGGGGGDLSLRTGGAPPVATEPAPLPSFAASGPAIARIRERGELLVGMDTGEPPGTGTPPMYVVGPDGAPDGFDYEVSRWIARSVGVDRVRVVHGKYSELPTLLTDQRPFDLIVSGYAPAPRAGIVWSAPYLEFGLCLVVPADSLVHGVSDLHGRPIGIFDDDAAAEAVAKLVPDNRGLTRMEDDYWDALLEGRFAGFIYDYPYAVAEIRDWYASHPGREGALRIAEFNLTDSSYSVGVRAAEPELLAAVNDGIARFRASPDYRAAVHTYLSTGNRPAAVATAGRAYSIQKGDTLSGIAAKELGSPARWSEIWELNKSRFPNPDSVDVGDEILLPPT